MNKNNQLGHSFKRQIMRTIKNDFPGLSKPNEQFMFEMVFGLIKSGDVKISNIARSLHEPSELKHTLKRLYSHLNTKDYSELVNDTTLGRYPVTFNEDTILALDFSDITKPYAEKMDNLSIVRDGDKGTYGKGYNQIVISATEYGEEIPTVLANELFSKEATPDKKSTDIALELLEKLTDYHGTNGVHVQDRYFDNQRFFDYFSKHNKRFVTRAKTNRKLLKVSSTGRVIPGKKSIVDLAKNCKVPHRMVLEYWENGQWKKKKQLRMGVRKVFLPCINRIVNLVVIKGFGKIPMMLLTNININSKNAEELKKIFMYYRCRWKCEELIRFVKVEYNLEDVRCLNWISLKNVISFVLYASNFIARNIGLRSRLESFRKKLIRISKPIFEDKAKMPLYMISKGVQEVLKFIPAAFRTSRQEISNEIQMELPL